MSSCIDFLETKVVQEEKLVTYKLLARSLKISTIVAKQALYDFYTSKRNLYVVYCISGTKLTEKEIGIQLVKARDLEVEKKKYRIISSSFVYSIASYDLSDFSALHTAILDISQRDRDQCGMLQHSTVQRNSTTSSPLQTDEGLSTQSEPDPHGGTKRKNSTQIEKSEAKKATFESPAATKKTILKQSTGPIKPNTTDTVSPQFESSLKVLNISSGDEDNSMNSQADPIEQEDHDMMDIDTLETSKNLETEEAPKTSRIAVTTLKSTTNDRGLMVTEETTTKPNTKTTAKKPNNSSSKKQRSISSFFLSKK
ncbi:DNA polymerase subunit Cdc27-domain-containing protein [Sporodiniella umbellata]|nr:DNA polymerase subunit Cdc27-domain-containing protein [Sporodiniella umbellata]